MWLLETSALQLSNQVCGAAHKTPSDVLLRLQGVKYNIPIQVWLPEAYARQPPIMYVVPTSTMIIKPSHSFVDASGVVSSPYVRNWMYGRFVLHLAFCM